MRLKTILIFSVLALFAFGAAGCGDDDEGINPTDDNPGLSEEEDAANQQSNKKTSSSTRLPLAANPDGELKYNKDQLTTKPGNVTIALTNESSVPHDVSVTDSSGKTLGTSDQITESDTSLELDDVNDGDYTFFCTVPGHEAAGMKGTLTVR